MGLGDSLKFTVGLDMSSAERQLSAFARFAGDVGSSISGLVDAGRTVGAVLGTGFSAAANALNSVMQSGSQMESFTSRLTVLMGSASDAKVRMGELFDFASSTPFELDQVVGAEVTMRGFGAATEELLPKLIDFSASLGTDLTQSAIDFGKAWNQGATGLESDTGKILRSMMEARSGLDLTKMGIEDFRALMLDTLDAKFAGGADRLSQTFGGMISNLQDEWSRFKLEVADAGVFNNVKAVLQGTLKVIGDNREAISRLAVLVSDGLWAAFKGVARTIAILIDGAEDFGKTMAGSVVPVVADLGIGFIKATEVFREFNAMVLDFAGDHTAAAAMRNLGVVGVDALQGIKQGALDFAGSLDATPDKIAKLEGFLAQAEMNAKGFGSALQDAMASGDKGGDQGGDSGKAKKGSSSDDLMAQFEDAMSFAEDMRTLHESETEQIQAEYDKRMEMARAYNEARLLTGTLYNDTIANIERDRVMALAELEDEQDQKRRDRNRDYADTVISGTAAMLGTLSDLLEDGNAKQRAAAKALATTEILVSGAAAGIKAFEQYGWPYGLVPAGLVAVQTGIALATVNKAHQGAGPEIVYAHQGAAPDEVDKRLLRSEAVLNSQASRALGPEGVQALNSGASMAPMMLNLTLGRTQQREVVRGELRHGYGALKSYVRDSSDEMSPGFTGGRALA